MKENSSHDASELSHSFAHRDDAGPSLCISGKNNANYEIGTAHRFYPFPRLLRDRTQFHFPASILS
jgi:hypothetical protein